MKSQLKKIVTKTVNFDSPNLTKPKKKLRNTHKKMSQHFHNTFYFQLW